LTLDPANAEALYMVAEIQRTLGKVEDAIGSIRNLLVLDPLNANLHVALSNRLLYQGKIEEALIEMNQAFELNPNRIAIHYLLARLYVMKGDPVMAFDELQKESDANWHMYGLPTVLFEKKLYKASEAALANLIEKRANERSLRIAEIYAWREDNDKAFEWLEHARVNHDQTLYLSLKNNVWLKKIENNPRFAKFLKKMNLPNNQK
jgi:Putative Zn-dependent protease, contains TPR repeats